MIDLRNISKVYEQVTPREPIEKLTTIIAKKDKFIGTDVQGI